jgi:hypothetical protein
MVYALLPVAAQQEGIQNILPKESLDVKTNAQRRVTTNNADTSR